MSKELIVQYQNLILNPLAWCQKGVPRRIRGPKDDDSVKISCENFSQAHVNPFSPRAYTRSDT